MKMDWFSVKVYALVYPSGKLVALDAPSGGYPYEVDRWHRAKLWLERKTAEEYARTVHTFGPFRVAEVLPQIEIDTEPVVLDKTTLCLRCGSFVPENSKEAIFQNPGTAVEPKRRWCNIEHLIDWTEEDPE